ncbi:MAG: DNA-binding protein [Ruminococcaceae bacterium]|nr:DNA-binding protein [Oscillospiraceae bacterium]
MKFPILLDTYGVLLTDRKREILDYYYNEDYSLTEISELTGISRQGVRDSIKKSEEEIYALESKLKIAEKNNVSSEILSSVIADLEEMKKTADRQVNDQLNIIIHKLESIKPQGERTDSSDQE